MRSDHAFLASLPADNQDDSISNRERTSVATSLSLRHAIENEKRQDGRNDEGEDDRSEYGEESE